MLKIFTKFSPRANPADGNYPNGSIKNESVPGAKDGTPLDADWGNDFLGFDEALLADAVINPSGNPDTVLVSDRLNALKTVSANESGKSVTLAAAKADVTAKAGQTRIISDRGNAVFEYKSSLTADGFSIIAHDTLALFLDLQIHYDTDIVAFGAIDGLASGIDNSPAINAFITKLKRFVIPDGDFEIQNPLIVENAIIAAGALWRGQGMERSTIRCVGMAGKNGIQLENGTGLYRFFMRDFQVLGDADFAAKLETTGEIFESELRNLTFTSVLDSALFIDSEFSIQLHNVHTNSTSGHAFEIEGGNSTLLSGCYGHNAGPGKAAYKIKGSAVLEACNGLDNGDIWGIFGADIANDGVNSTYRIEIIGGNAEEFKDVGIITRFTGSLRMNNFNMLPPSVGVSPTFNGFVEMQCSNSTLVRNDGTWVSKGSVIQNLEQVKTLNTQFRIELNQTDDTSPDYEQGGLSKKSAVAGSTAGVTEFGVNAQKFGLIDCDRNYGFNSEIPLVSVDTSNIDVTGKTKLILEDTVATFIDSATGFVRCQELTMMVNSNNSTIRHLAAGAGRFNLLGAASIVASQGDVFKFVTFDGVQWEQYV